MLKREFSELQRVSKYFYSKQKLLTVQIIIVIYYSNCSSNNNGGNNNNSSNSCYYYNNYNGRLFFEGLNQSLIFGINVKSSKGLCKTGGRMGDDTILNPPLVAFLCLHLKQMVTNTGTDTVCARLIMIPIMKDNF